MSTSRDVYNFIRILFCIFVIFIGMFIHSCIRLGDTISRACWGVESDKIPQFGTMGNNMWLAFKHEIWQTPLSYCMLEQCLTNNIQYDKYCGQIIQSWG